MCASREQHCCLLLAQPRRLCALAGAGVNEGTMRLISFPASGPPHSVSWKEAMYFPSNCACSAASVASARQTCSEYIYFYIIRITSIRSIKNQAAQFFNVTFYGTLFSVTLYFPLGDVYSKFKPQQSTDMAGPCSIWMDFDYTEAKL